MKLYAFSVIASVCLVACGGGSGSTTDKNTSVPSSSTSSLSSSAPPKTANITQGTIAGFGSVIVNGIHFDVKEATIEIDGTAKTESDLAVGQMVSITGVLDDDGLRGKASKLSAETKMRGPIESIDLSKGIIVVLGQQILIDADTFYEDAVAVENLKIGDVVKVSSHINSNSILVATRLEIKSGSEAKELFLAGKVTNLNVTAMTFTINNAKVEYSKATIADLPNKTLEEGMLVRVQGLIVDGVFVANGNIHLSAFDLKHHGNLDTKAKVEIDGIVSKLNIPASEMLLGPVFLLGDTTVFFTTAVKIEGGTLLDLKNGIRVRVKGKLDADSNITAEKIVLMLSAKVEDEGLVQATDIAKNTLTIKGTVFEVTADTSFNDRSKTDVRLFSLKDIVTGDFVNVRGYKVSATGSIPEKIIATRIERKNPSGK